MAEETLGQRIQVVPNGRVRTGSFSPFISGDISFLALNVQQQAWIFRKRLLNLTKLNTAVREPRRERDIDHTIAEHETLVIGPLNRSDDLAKSTTTFPATWLNLRHGVLFRRKGAIYARQTKAAQSIMWSTAAFERVWLMALFKLVNLRAQCPEDSDNEIRGTIAKLAKARRHEAPKWHGTPPIIGPRSYGADSGYTGLYGQLWWQRSRTTRSWIIQCPLCSNCRRAQFAREKTFFVRSHR